MANRYYMITPVIRLSLSANH